MPDLPASLQEAIFCHCDSKSQFALAQTSKPFWKMYHTLKCISPYNGCQPTDYHTACRKWRRDATEAAAARFARQFRADMHLKALKPTFHPNDDSCYHASLVGHLTQMHLQFRFEHPQLQEAELHNCLSEIAVGRLHEALQVDAINATKVVMFTLQVYHSRQAGFSDAELDKLGAVFHTFPADASLWLLETPLEPATLMCEPVWQLLSPSKQASCMYWDTEDTESIFRVAQLSEVIDS